MRRWAVWGATLAVVLLLNGIVWTLVVAKGGDRRDLAAAGRPESALGDSSPVSDTILVPGVGFEPTSRQWRQRILSPPRLPVPPPRLDNRPRREHLILLWALPDFNS